jgi:toxin CcdB
MAQFDLFRNPRRGGYPLLLDVQSDLLARLATRVVVPLMTEKKYGARPITRLNPLATIDGVSYVLVFQELAAVPPDAVGARVGTLSARRAELIAALDLLFTGV